MKTLKVKWVSETIAVVSLSIVPAPTINGDELEFRRCEHRNVPTKLIVIHDAGKLLQHKRAM